MYQINYNSPIGVLRIFADQQGLRYLSFPNDMAKITAEYKPSFPILKQTVEILDRYFAGKPVDFNQIDLAPMGTIFQQQVWQQLAKIPYGKTVCYGDIANAINNPKAVRAIGGAVGANPIGIILPCHRVLGKDRSLTGFGGGLDTKIALLTIEKIPFVSK